MPFHLNYQCLTEVWFNVYPKRKHQVRFPRLRVFGAASQISKSLFGGPLLFEAVCPNAQQLVGWTAIPRNWFLCRHNSRVEPDPQTGGICSQKLAKSKQIMTKVVRQYASIIYPILSEKQPIHEAWSFPNKLMKMKCVAKKVSSKFKWQNP
jgi:hypothetical protein